MRGSQHPPSRCSRLSASSNSLASIFKTDGNVVQLVRGRVTSIAPFAIWVDIGCTVNGTLVAPPHISEHTQNEDIISNMIVERVDEATDCIELSMGVDSIETALSAAPAPAPAISGVQRVPKAPPPMLWPDGTVTTSAAPAPAAAAPHAPVPSVVPPLDQPSYAPPTVV